MRHRFFRRVLPILLLLALLPLKAVADCPDDPSVLESEFLRVVTLNIAHGRKDARNQVFLKGETIRDNLLEVAGLMDQAEADVIALQEADAGSKWSGKFNHVELLAENSANSCVVHGIHASNRIYNFGTALLSRHAFQGAFTHTFKPSKPTTTKGFSVGALDWNPGGALAVPKRVKFVSVHLDFSRRSVRRSQIAEMVSVLGQIEGPMILLGDFNTDWQTEDSSLKYLADTLGLAVYKPHAEGLSTYGEKGARLDWILISPELEFSIYYVKPDVVSDHYAVAADIILKEKP
jgi:endonuclease/exonuclease/phosphatase family metal-dependent hydrolase